MSDYRTVLPSGTRTGDQAVDVTDVVGGRGIIVVTNIQSIVSGSIVTTIQGRDRASDTYYDILAGLSQTASTQHKLIVYPGLTGSNNLIASHPLPYDIRIKITAASGTASYSVGASFAD